MKTRSQLIAERKAQAEQNQTPAEAPPLFDSVNASPLDPIIQTIVSDDVLRHYKRLEEELTIGEMHSDYGTVLQAVDRAESNARLANKLFLAGRIEKDKIISEVTIELSDLRNQAQAELHNEKVSGTRTKQITDADIEAKCSQMNPSLWRTCNQRIRQAKAAETDLENLSEIWKSRCRTLQTILHTLRK